MWPFSSRQSLFSIGIFNGFTDCHSHILPGVDDGVKHIEESLEILQRYEEMGIRSVWLTPHIMEDIPNTTDGLRARFDVLRSAYKGPVELHLGAENMIDTLFENRLKSYGLKVYHHYIIPGYPTDIPAVISADRFRLE